MTARPRHPDQRLFDSTVLTRGLWQGTGLLLLLLTVYGGVRSATNSDDTARAVMFMVLVLSNLGLIQANRAWGRGGHMSWRSHITSNPSFIWITLASLILLVCVLGIPAVGRLFAFARPTPPILLAGAAVAVVSLLWLQIVNWGFGRWRADRKLSKPGR